MGCISSTEVPYQQQRAINRDSVTDPPTETIEHKKNDKNIEKYMDYQRKMEMRIKKMLLLGAGSSGKSTLFKQLKQIYKYGLDEGEYLESKRVIRVNCVVSILTLLKKSQILYESNPKMHSDTFINLDQSPHIIAHIKNVLKFATPNSKTSVENLTKEDATLLNESISFLWKLPQIQCTFSKRQYFSFIENMDFFFDKMDTVFDTEYMPSYEDTLKCRIRTTGLIEEKYIINDVQFNIFDGGGQRSERKKWIVLFEGVTALIFVAALNHYATVLFEDESKNSMHESLELFDEICNSKWFRKTEIILFLNKNDLYEQRVRQGISLSVAFEDWNKSDDYVPIQDDAIEDEEEFRRCCNVGTEFIRQQYQNLNRHPYKKIFVHITTATNKENIESVFWDVQNIVVSQNMQTSGLV